MLPDIFTIGHEGLTMEELFRTLMENDITLIIDVRIKTGDFPVFEMLESLEIKYNYKIDYEWFKVLANPFTDRDDWEEYYRAYLIGMDRELEDLRNLIIINHTCLLGYERDPTKSHRLILAEKLKHRFGLQYVDLSHVDYLVKKYSPKALLQNDDGKTG
jgi:uncharacterized protein (DUF488 family)